MQRRLDEVYAGSDTPGLKPIVLVRNVKSCCGLRLKINPRPSLPLVYTQQGTLIGAIFHGVCKVCSAKYYSYKEVDDKESSVRTYNRITMTNSFKCQAVLSLRNYMILHTI